MEDAMVINRGSLQRGFAHGQVYKSEIIDLKEAKNENTAMVKKQLMKTNRVNQLIMFKS